MRQKTYALRKGMIKRLLANSLFFEVVSASITTDGETETVGHDMKRAYNYIDAIEFFENGGFAHKCRYYLHDENSLLLTVIIISRSPYDGEIKEYKATLKADDVYFINKVL